MAGVLRRQNLLTYSEQFEQAVWGGANFTKTPDALANPLDGAMTAERVTATAVLDTTDRQFTVVRLPFTYSVYMAHRGVFGGQLVDGTMPGIYTPTGAVAVP